MCDNVKEETLSEEIASGKSIREHHTIGATKDQDVAITEGPVASKGKCRNHVSDWDKDFGCSLDLEGLLVDQAIDNVMTLPEALNEVVSMQRGQCDEIQKQECLLKLLEDQIEKAKAKNDSVKQETNSTMRKIQLLEEDKSRLRKICKDTESEIKVIVKDVSGLRNKKRQLEDMITEEERKHSNYGNKMAEFQREVEKFESSLEVFSKVNTEEKNIEELRMQASILRENNREVTEILNGEMEERLQDVICSLQREEGEIDLKVVQQEHQVQGDEKRLSYLEKSIQVLEKRNSAQMMRLRRQIKEVGSRNKRWNDQILNLQETVQELRHKLGE